MAVTYTADVNANDLTYRPCSKDPLKIFKSQSYTFWLNSILNELGH